MKNPVKDKDKKKRSYRVYRGGSWRNAAWYARASFRYDRSPSYRFSVLGFRIVRTKK